MQQMHSLNPQLVPRHVIFQGIVPLLARLWVRMVQVVDFFALVAISLTWGGGFFTDSPWRAALARSFFSRLLISIIALSAVFKVVAMVAGGSIATRCWWVPALDFFGVIFFLSLCLPWCAAGDSSVGLSRWFASTIVA